jgi:hypothetical protein
MTNDSGNDPTFSVEARATIRASAGRVYNLIADYHKGHPRILPPRYFQNLVVESGGFGTGTVITFEMKALGRIQHSRARSWRRSIASLLSRTFRRCARWAR